MDQHLTILREANKLYKTTQNLTNQQRYDAVISLNEWGVFTPGHLSKISGVSEKIIKEWVGKTTAKKAQFNPKTLDVLIQLCQNRQVGLPISDVLLAIALDGGNSQRMIAELTGIPQSTIGRRVTNAANRSTDLL